MKRMYQQPSIQTTENICTAQVLCASGEPVSSNPQIVVDNGTPKEGLQAW